MRTRVLAVTLALGVFALVAAFIWATVGTLDPRDTVADRDVPTAEVSEVLPDGRIDVQVYALGNRDVRLEIQFTPNGDAVETAAMRPDVNFAMVEMHMDGFDPPLQLIEAGAWRANLKLPMAGRWVVSVGFGEDRAEVEFDAE
ncbi:FixH family protein [Haematobacter massiliensis]|uniref:FixH family protein n=1 Tax=Haematobacter massiliensis TaxID=195105 RepID=UPI001124F8C4|nr:FixH family protein [Haematobacter massiliensis]